MLLPFTRPTDSHEAWFGHHYADLRRWATHFTAGDPDAAEDLVHDLFVHIMTSRPELAAIENPKAFFYTSLRNLHVSNARRRARHHELVVGNADFDVLEYASLRATIRDVVSERHGGLLRDQFEDQLRGVWRYVHLRKTSSKGASVLILRFFHGYYPEEIALILRTSRDAVDQLLRQARKEARLFVDDPESGDASDDGAGSASGWPVHGLLSPPDLVKILQEGALRSDPEGRCVSDDEIAAVYPDPSSDSGQTVRARLLAHLVSCHACLDRVTRRLDLPAPTERHPLDSLGYDRDTKPPRGSSDGGGGTGASSAGGRFSRGRRPLGDARRRLSELLAHTPKELRIAVNGVMLGSQEITSAVSRQTLRLTTPSADFLEVFSERDVRLLFMNLEAPPHGPLEIEQTIGFDGGRRLKARVNFTGASPLVHVSYVDPASVETPAVLPAPATETTPRPSFVRRLRDRTARLLWPRFRPMHGWMSRRGTFTAVIAMTIMMALVMNQIGEPVLSAAALLEKSSAAEAAWRTDAAHAVYRTVALEARRRDTGTTTRRRIEIWQSAARGMIVRRAFDEHHRLLAGEWIDATGKKIVHRARAAANGVARVGHPEPRVGDLEAWRFEPSADHFARLVGAVDRATAKKDGDGFQVAFDNAGAPAGTVLLSASLKMRPDWRAIEQRATVRTEDGTTELVWTELTWTTSPAARIPAATFEIDPSLAATSPPASVPTAAITPPATADLEIAALAALRRIDADLGQEVRVERTDGRLHITGVVASASRQAQIRAVLAGVHRHPAARVRIETVDEAHANARRGGASPVPLASSEEGLPAAGPRQIPAHEPVRASLLRAGIEADAADAEVARVANRIVRQTLRMRSHAWALRTLLSRIGPADVTGLGAPARQEWRALIAEHGREFGTDAAALQSLLEPIYPRATTSSTAPLGATPFADDDQRRRIAAQFVERADALDGQLVPAFTMPATGTALPAFDAPRFWSTFTQTTALAAELADSAARRASQHP